ncbi:pseudouridine synthase [Serinicoccus kebangsaanensis]|uniref:pseudouridine synthase n=1 Tax=Serinicoccus kebangsaanensis TaxID=2602069 RepID=UPI00124EC442|nr:pseudouridine synthase [Serinicoccus kebangsaanensis]
MPRRSRPQPPLPPRDGLGAARVRMPVDGSWSTVRDFLVARTGDPDGVDARIALGEVLLPDRTPVAAATAYRPGGVVHLYRDLPPEHEVPFAVEVIARDDRTGLLVVDKPPFLATTPRGGHVAETVLVRLRRELDLPELAPVHRLDRLTSGVLLLTTRREARSAYQRLVQDGGVAKVYEALAPAQADLDLPVTVRNRIVKKRGELQARAVPGEPNAVTRVERLGSSGTAGRYRLVPSTGRTHQLRVHLAGLGIPIQGDPLYPRVLPVSPGDFTTPMQLLAARVDFVDPVSGEPRTFTSRRTLPISGAVGSA